MSNPVVLRQRSHEALPAAANTHYTDVYHTSVKNGAGNIVKFMHNVAALGHGQLTGKAFNRDGQTFVPMKLRNKPITLAPLVTDQGVYHCLESFPHAAADRIGYVFSRALQLIDNYVIDKFLIGEEYQSPASPLKADSLCSFVGRLVVGIASFSGALLRLALLTVSAALRAVLWVASVAVEYLIVKLLYQVLKGLAHLIWGIALIASQLTVGIVAIPVNFVKLSAWFFSLGWFTAELPIDRTTFGAVYRAFERFKTNLTTATDLRPQREESSDPGEDGSVRALTPRRRADLFQDPLDYSAVPVVPMPQEL